MYLTGGQYKGRKVIIPNCAKPTLSKVRQGVFNILFSILGDFSQFTFFDMFSGSGLMGLEALSRGFRVICVEKEKSAVEIIKKNFKTIDTGYEIIEGNSLQFVKKADIYPEVIYVDPPWNFDYLEIFNAIKKFKNSLVVVESDKKRARELDAIYAKFTAPFKQKVYGRCKVDFIKLI